MISIVSSHWRLIPVSRRPQPQRSSTPRLHLPFSCHKKKATIAESLRRNRKAVSRLHGVGLNLVLLAIIPDKNLDTHSYFKHSPRSSRSVVAEVSHIKHGVCEACTGMVTSSIDKVRKFVVIGGRNWSFFLEQPSNLIMQLKYFCRRLSEAGQCDMSLQTRNTGS